MTMNENVATEEFRCEHCNKTFIKPGTLLKHLCEPKRRWMDRDRPANRIAFIAWSKFYQQYQPRGKKKEYRDFAASAYYGGFVKYGTYCADVGVVNPLMYVDWLLKEKISLDNWASDKHYGKFLIEYTRLEDGMDAVRRSVETLLKFAEEENLQIGDVLRYTNANKICHKIVGGKLSPWLLFNSESGRYFLSTLNTGQMQMVFEYINPDIWNIKFMRDKENVKDVQTLLQQAGI
jgi:hypothetical protein